MKILITHEIFPPEFVGGGEKLMLKLATMLLKNGHSVKILTTGNPKIKKYDHIPTIRIPINRYGMMLALPKIIGQAKDVDLIQTSSGNSCLPSWFAAKILNKPICCYVHHILGKYWKNVKGPLLGSVFESMEKNFLIRDYDAIIFQNKSSMQLGLEYGIKKSKTYLLQPGIDYKKFQMKIKKKPFVLFVGNFDMNESICKTKGLSYLIEAARQLPEIRFVVVGKGSYLNKLKKISPPNIDFTGPLIGKPLIKLFNEAMIFCLPSLNEGFGLTILEAMASGCAIISTIDIGQEGIIIKPKNTEQIKKAVEVLLDNQAKTIKIGQKNRELAKKFTWNKFLDDVIKIYDSVIRK